jgi:acetylornithine deacetylase
VKPKPADPNEQLELLQQLIAINSVNPSLVLGEAGEKEISEFIASYLERLGLEVRLQPARKDRPNVVGILRGSGGGRSLMLNGHMDTVGVAGMIDPFVGRFGDGKVYGRGAFDMKGAISSMLLAAKLIKQSQVPLKGDLILTTVVDEEFASIGTEAIAKEYKADAALVLESTELQIGIAHKGFAWIDVETFGKATHGSKPDLGVDAIISMGQFLTELGKLEDGMRKTHKHPLLGSGSVHASLIQGGKELSTYPDHCLLQLERRTVPGETQKSVELEIQTMMDQLRSQNSKFEASFHTTFYRDPWEADPNSELVRTLGETILARTGHQAEKMATFGWMDSSILDKAGIPCAIFGPGGFGAHGLVEYSNFDQVLECTNTVIDLIQAFCG